MSEQKSNTLLIGCGGVGTIAALNLESGGQVEVTAVLRSNHDAVKKDGFTIKSCDHGTIKNWKPSKGPNLECLNQLR
jgi:ketopantoate reductase